MDFRSQSRDRWQIRSRGIDTFGDAARWVAVEGEEWSDGGVAVATISLSLLLQHLAVA